MTATFEYLGMFMLANILIINGNADRKGKEKLHKFSVFKSFNCLRLFSQRRVKSQENSSPVFITFYSDVVWI